MIEAIQRFVSALRREGVGVTPAEAIDAARAVRLVGIEDKEDFRLALRFTLAKTRPEVEAFDRAFRSFFKASPAGRRKGRGAGATAGAGRRGPPRVEPAEAGKGSRPPRSREMEARRRRGRLKVILDRRPGRPVVTPQAVREMRRDARRSEAGRSPRPRRRRPPGSPGPDDPALAREVARVLLDIRLRSGRRLRRRRRGTLWSARVMRLNIGTEGVPFVLPFRKRRPRRPRIVLLVDVSWSVMRTSSTFLSIAREALARNRRTSVHLFVDRCVDATDVLARDPRRDPASIRELITSIGELDAGAPSDYGSAFYQAAHAPRGRVARTGPDTILVVMGDARSNFRDPQSWAFDDLATRCRRVIWLNPEPASLWNTGDSVLSEYLPSCDVVCEATDPDGMARGVGEIIRSL